MCNGSYLAYSYHSSGTAIWSLFTRPKSLLISIPQRSPIERWPRRFSEVDLLLTVLYFWMPQAMTALSVDFAIGHLVFCLEWNQFVRLVEPKNEPDVGTDRVPIYDWGQKTNTLTRFAMGLLLITPLGDLVRRRQLILLLIIASTTLTIGLSITPNFCVFETVYFLVGVSSVTPQILMPLAADLAPPERRASALSVVLSGLIFGILISRVLAGIIRNFTTWRAVYYMTIGVQGFVLIGTYFILPDYPQKNPDLTYFEILYTMAKYAVTEPLVMQASLIIIASSACFAGYWITLTFLLGGPPYHFSALGIGLFGFVGLFSVRISPFLGCLIDKFVPWYASLVSTSLLVVFQSIQSGAGGINMAAVIIPCIALDAARQTQRVALTTAVLGISAAARARLNAILVLSLFIGQAIGTSVSAHVYAKYGWRASSLLLLALYGFQLVVLLLRGPHCPMHCWIGWAGGWSPRKGMSVKSREKGRCTSPAMVMDGSQIPGKTGEGLKGDTGEKPTDNV